MANGFVGFLKKFGQEALKDITIASGIAPVVAPFIKVVTPDAVDRGIDVAVNDLQSFAGVVQSIEIAGQAGGLDGAKKLQLASPLIKQIVLQSFMLKNHNVADPVRFQKGIDEITSGVADVLSSLEGKVDTTKKS